MLSPASVNEANYIVFMLSPESNNEAKYPGSNNEPKYPAAMPFDEGDIQTGKLASTLGNVVIYFRG